MKRFVLALMFGCASLFGAAQTSNPHYDKALADSLGANEYGMKAYVLVILKTGANTSLAKPASDSLFAGHMKNIMQLLIRTIDSIPRQAICR